MTKSKIQKATESIKSVSEFSKDSKELINAAKKAVIDAKELIDHLKSIIDDADFPELKKIRIPNIKLPESKKYQHDLIKYNSSNVNWLKLSAGLDKYIQIKNSFYLIDVSGDQSFQKLFNGFYKIRQRPKEFYLALYRFLEDHKNDDVCFESVITHFFNLFGKVEASFSSKIAATINPKLPVWDSIVIKHLGLRKPGNHLDSKVRLQKTIDLYSHISKFYADFLKHKLANKMIVDFDAHFPKADISDIKQIDLILWQTRT